MNLEKLKSDKVTVKTVKGGNNRIKEIESEGRLL